MRRTVAIGVCGLILAACSPGGESEAPADAAGAGTGTGTGAVTADPAAARGREAVYAVQAEGPEPFVRALYARYVAGGPTGEPPAPGQDPIFSRTMNALIGADVRAANGEVPTLNYDPFCGCQDQADFTLMVLAVAQADANTAEATVSFANMGEAKSMRLKLVREGPNWKVDDIIDGETSLHDTLMRLAEAAG